MEERHRAVERRLRRGAARRREVDGAELLTGCGRMLVLLCRRGRSERQREKRYDDLLSCHDLLLSPPFMESAVMIAPCASRRKAKLAEYSGYPWRFANGGRRHRAEAARE